MSAATSIGVRSVPDQRVLTVTRTVRVGQIDDHIDSAADELTALSVGVGPLFVIYHGELTTEVANPVEVCLPVDDAVQPAGQAIVRVDEAHHEAFRAVTKTELEYPEILDVYAELDNYLRENGWQPSGPLREIYLRDFSDSTMDDAVCEVAFPFTS